VKDHLRTARLTASLKQGRADWFKIENKGSSATVMIYDEIGYFGVTAQDFVNQLNALDVADITLKINSPGGEVFDAVAIYNALKDHPATVAVQIDGLAASAASFIAMAGDTISIQRNATMMIHDAAGLAIGNAADMRELADLLDGASNNIADIYAQRAGGTAAEWRARMQATTWYNNGAEAVAAGLADTVLGADAEPAPDNTWDLSVFNKRTPEPAEPEFDIDAITSALREAMK
jgi:ATP-dependent protease ClpP protease subunit